MLVAVEETVTSNGKQGSGEVAVAATIAAALLVPMLAHAQIVPSGAHAPNVIATPNGLPQVNVNRPSGAGVSVNSYSQFDVQKNGVILNNSPTVTNTQLAGYINGNPNYAPGQSAKIIVNQVNSANPSQFNGPAEIAGNAATFVLANPSGISVNGGAFINTNRAVLTTGTPNYAPDGSLAGYSINGGTITVQGAGFNAANVDQVDILARAVQANAAIYAGKNLNVIAGANQIDHNTLAATPIAGNGPAPSVAIDVSQLGGMYSGKIFLASNEYGVGVSTQGVIAAQSGDLALQSNGQLVLAGRQSASGNVVLNATQGINNSGTTYAQQALSASTAGTLANSGTLAAQGAVNASAGAVASTGALAAGVDNNGNATQPGSLNVTASGALSATGQNVAGGQVSLAGSSVNLAGSQTAANGNLTLTANEGDLNLAGARSSAGGAVNASATGALVNDHGSMTGGSGVTLNAGSISNQAGAVSAQGPLVAQASGQIANQGGSFVSQNAMQVRGGAIANNAGTMQAALGFQVSGSSLDNTAGHLLSLNGDGLNLGVTGTLVNGLGGVIGGNGNVNVSAYTFTNAGQLTAAANAVLQAWGITNSGTVKAGSALTATASGALSNAGGSLSGATTTVSGASIDNTKGDIEGTTVAVSTPGALVNQGGSIEQSGTAAQAITAGGTLDNSSGGKIASNATSLSIAGAALNNNSGSIQHAGTGTLDVGASGALTSVGGNIASNGSANLHGASVDNTGGSATASQNLSVQAQAISNESGKMGAGNALNVNATSALDNRNGSMVAANVTAQTGGGFDNSNGNIEANQLSVSAANLLNRGGSITQYGASPMGFNVSGLFDNSAGGTFQTNATNVTLAPGALINDNGTITHAGTGKLTINAGDGAGSASNAGGKIQGNGDVEIDAGALSNTAGTVTGQTGVTATVAGALDNENGNLVSNRDLNVTSGTLNNNGGQLGAGANATIQNGSMTNSGGTVVAPNLTIRTSGTLDDSNGNIQANQLSISAANLLNRGGSITQYSASPMGFNVSGLFDNSAGGTFQTNATNVTLAPGALVNDGGTITHAGTGKLTINAGNGAGSASNSGGTIQGNGDVEIDAGALNNTAGTVTGQTGVTATVGGALDNENGNLVSNRDLSVTSGTLNNNGGQLGAGANATIQNGSMTNSGGTIVAPNLTIRTSGTLDDSNGNIQANQLALSATDLVNRAGTITQFGTGPTGFYVSGTYDNTLGTFQTNATNVTFSPGTLINDYGKIIDAGTGTLTITPEGGAGAFSNVGGQVIAAGGIYAQAASMNNTGGVFAAQGNITANIAGDLLNEDGSVRSLSSLSLASGGKIDNTRGQVQSGTGTAGDASMLAIHAASVDDTNGLIGNLGTGDTTVRGDSQIVNSGGVVTGNGKVSVDTSALVNTQNAQLSGASVAIQADTVDNSDSKIGSFAGSNGDVSITTTGAVTNTSGQIGATHNLSVNAAALTGGGAYSATNDVAVSVQGDFAPTPDLQFAAGNNLSFTLPGTFSNSALVEAANNLDVNAGAIGNSGVMMAGGTLTTHSDTLVNTGTMVGGSVSLNANSKIANVGPTALIGATDSNGTLELLAPEIDNVDSTTATDTQATTAIYGLGKVVLAGGKDANGNYTNANLIFNQSGLIESAADMELHASQVTNTRTTMTTTGLNQPVSQALLDQLGLSLSGCTAIYMDACGPGNPVVWGNGVTGDPNMIGGVFIDPPHGGSMNSTYQYTTYTGTALANLVAGISPQAQIISGGNLDASNVGTFQNYWSAVAAVGNVAAPVSLDQNSWQGQAAPSVQITYSGLYHYRTYDGKYWTYSFCDGSGCNAPADIKSYALPAYESPFVAGGTLSGTGISIDNTAGNAGIPSLGLAPGQALTGVTIGGISGSAGANAGAASSVSGSAGANAGGASSVSGSAGGTKGGASSVNGGTMINPAIASATAQTVLQNLTIPQGGLFSPATAPGASYLIETNPAFTNQKTFISSDYYLQQLGLNPQTTEKRLGDGFYEQQLVRNQITSLTGKAVLGPYTDLQSMYQSLLAAGASLSKSLDLPLGMSLSPEQVEQLTSNVIIMQTEVVDGQSVLVPVVYLAKTSQQNMNGPLIAATDIDLQNAQTFTNSGTVQASNTMSIQGQQINNAFGALQSGGLMSLNTTGNIDLTSATVKAGSLALNAGGDLLLNTAAKTVDQIGANGATRSTTTLGPVASVNVADNAAIVTGGNFEQNGANLNVGGNLGMAIGGNYDIGTVQTGEHKVVARANGVSDTNVNQANGSTVNVGGVSQIGVGGDLTATGANINLGGGGVVAAKGNVTFQAAKATSTVDSNSAGSDSHGSYSESLHKSDDTLTATTLNAGNSLTIASGKDINVTGSAITLDKGTATLAAAGNVNIGAATETHVDNSQEQHSHSNVVSGKEVRSSSDTTVTLSQGSLVSGDAVQIASGKDINVAGSTIVGTNDVALNAAHDVNITTTQDAMQSATSYQEKRTGLGTSGLTVTVGTNKLATTDQESSVTNNASTVGSVNGNLSIQAGNTLHVTGSDLVAGGNVTGTAANVVIDSATDTTHQAQTQKQSSSGLTIGLSGSVGDAINNAYAQGQAIGHSASSGNDRAAALHAIATAGDAAIAGMGGAALAGDAAGPTAPSISIQVSVGSSKSQSQSSEDQTIQRGSNVQAGGTAAFVATNGDLTIAGSNVSANDVVLAAKNQVNVINTTSTDSTRSSNSSSSASAGVSFGTQGWGVSASMANAHGDANSDASIQNASHVTGGNSVTVISGGDTNITGSQIAGKQVTADVGGNLNVASVQDVTNSAAHQSSAGGGFSISQGGGSASFSAQNGHADSNYAGVNEQAGIMAGDGGFNVNVKGNTGLTGAVISSAADASQNSLTTGTLTYSDVANHSHYDANSNGISTGVGVGNTGKAVGPGSVSNTASVAPMMSQNDNGDSSATTRSAISAGTINITNQGAQTQNVASLSRDTTNTNGTVANTPDVNNILNQQADTMQAAQAAGQVVAQGIGQYADNKREAAVKAGDQATAAAWDEGGDNRTALHIAGGALIGGLGGGTAFSTIGGAAGAGLASHFANQLDSLSKGVASETGSDLIGNLAGNVAAGLGGAVVGGTAGSATGSAVELYNQQLDPKKKDMVAKICGAGAQCSDATLNAAIQAQGQLNDVAQNNVADTSYATAAAAGVVAGTVLGPEAFAAYKAAQAGYSLVTAALTGSIGSGVLYTATAVGQAGFQSMMNGANFGEEFSNRFSLAGLAVTSAYGAAGNMFGTQMYNWAGVPNSLANIMTTPGIVTRLNTLALGQTLGRAVKSTNSNANGN